MDLAVMTADEMHELRGTILSWIDRRELSNPDDDAISAICAIDNFREMVRQIEGFLCRLC